MQVALAPVPTQIRPAPHWPSLVQVAQTWLALQTWPVGQAPLSWQVPITQVFEMEMYVVPEATVWSTPLPERPFIPTEVPLRSSIPDVWTVRLPLPAPFGSCARHLSVPDWMIVSPA